ncbi:MAG TPA: oligosaccharide flippase family protein [Ktedonobacteraceae bacterium]|nr:oligosaccharide flippase family protein [Ktedonobacteraceae bacterium]
MLSNKPERSEIPTYLAIEKADISLNLTQPLPILRSERLTDPPGMETGFEQSLFDYEKGLSYNQAFSEMQTWILPVIEINKFRDAARKPVKISDGKGESHTTILRNLLKTSGIYAIASYISPLLSLILSPFLAHSLSKADFGALAVLTTFIALMAGITQMGLSSAFFRVYVWEYESSQDRLKVISTTLMLLFLFSGPILALLMITIPFFVGVLLNSTSYTVALRLAALAIFMQNLTVPGFAWLRAENRAMYYSALTAVQLLITLITTLLLVGKLQMGIVGALLATGSGYAIVILITLPVIVVHAGLSARWDITKSLLSLGIPTVTNYISVWVLQLSDRYLLSRMGSLSVTASYAVAYSLGGILSSVIIAPFSLAWPTTMLTIAERKDAPQIFRQVFRWFVLVLLLGAFGLSLLSVVMLHLLFPSGYNAATPIIPVITLSIVFYGTYIVFTVGIGITRKTWLVVIFTTFSALINLGLNLVLIRLFGSMGAAFSTLVAYIALAAVTYFANQRIYPIPFEIGLFAVALLVGITLFETSAFITQNWSLFASLALHFVSFCVYGVCLAFLGKFASWRTQGILVVGNMERLSENE